MVVSEIAAAMEDLREQIMVRRVIHDDISMVPLVHDAVQSDDARVRRGELVQGDFAYVYLPLASGLVARSD